MYEYLWLVLIFTKKNYFLFVNLMIFSQVCLSRIRVKRPRFWFPVLPVMWTWMWPHVFHMNDNHLGQNGPYIIPWQLFIPSHWEHVLFITKTLDLSNNYWVSRLPHPVPPLPSPVCLSHQSHPLGTPPTWWAAESGCSLHPAPGLRFLVTESVHLETMDHLIRIW